MNVTLRQLRLFSTLATRLNFTEAAIVLHISQPALTSAIKALEEELGCKLFDRSSRQVHLSAEGRHLQSLAEKLLPELDTSLANLKAASTGMKEHVTFSAAPSFLRYIACPAIADVAAKHPNVSVHVLGHSAEAAIEGILAEKIDFAICGTLHDLPGISKVQILRDRVGAIASSRVLGNMAIPLRWTDLDPRSYITFTSGYGVRQHLEKFSPIPDIIRHPRFEVSSISSLGVLLTAGIGYGIVPAMIAQPLLQEGLRFLPLEEPRLFRELQLVKLKNRQLSVASTELIKRFAPILHRLNWIEGIEILLDETTTRAFLNS